MTNIQNSWKTAKVSDVTEYVNRGVPPIYTNDNSGTAVINQKCIRDGKVNFDFARLTDESNKPIPHNKLVQPYDILINSTGTGTVGRVGQVIDLTQRTTVDTHVTIVRPKKDIIDPVYLGYWMKNKQDELENLAGGSTNQVELSRSKIAELDVIIPSFNTQKKISEIISILDITINNIGTIIQKTEILKRGILEEIIEKGIEHKSFKKTKLGRIPQEWEIESLGKIAQVERGKFSHRPRNDPDFYGGNIPFIQTGDVVSSYGRIKSYSQTLNEKGLKVSKLFKKGTIVLTIAANIGDTGILEFDACFPDSLVGITPSSKINSIYLEYFLRSQKTYLNSIATQSAQKNINLAKLNPMLIAVPPMQEQKKIADILSTIDKKLSVERAEKERLISLKQGIMDDIFNRKVLVS